MEPRTTTKPRRAKEAGNESTQTFELAPQDSHQGSHQVAAPVQNQMQPATPTPMDLIATAVQRGASVAEIEQLMNLKDRLEASEARKAFVAAMAAFKRNPPTILKNKVADFKTEKGRTTYAYSNLSNVCDAIIAALAEQGISHDWAPAQQGNTVTITCTLTHELGHTKTATLSASADQTGGKNAIQAIGSAVSYLERYTLLAACGIAVGDGSDDDGEGFDTNAVRDAAAASRGRATPADIAAARNGNAAPSDKLLADARASADAGRSSFGPFWKGITPEQRGMLRGELPDLEQRADQAGK